MELCLIDVNLATRNRKNRKTAGRMPCGLEMNNAIEFYSSNSVGSQPTRSALARSFSRARFWIWRTRSLLIRSR